MIKISKTKLFKNDFNMLHAAAILSNVGMRVVKREKICFYASVASTTGDSLSKSSGYYLC